MIEALDAGAALVTDVGSVKAPVVAAVEAARPDARAALRRRSPDGGLGAGGPRRRRAPTCSWAPPGCSRPPGAPTRRRSPRCARGSPALGAEVIAVDARAARRAGRGGEPRAAAGGVDADERGQRGHDEHAVLLRLAAGGFRDMTRIASSHPAIWPDICLANRDAIVAALDATSTSSPRVRAHRRRGRPRRRCSSCWSRRASPGATCPSASPPTSTLFELRIPVPDREGVIAEVATLAAALRRQHRRPRDRPLARGSQRCARARRRRARADAFEQALRRARLPRRRGRRSREDPGVSVPTDLAVSGPHRCAGGCACPATRGSRTARCCSRRWPTAGRAWSGLAGGDDVFRTRRALARLGVRITIAGSAVDRRRARRRRRSASRRASSTAATRARRCALLAGLLAGRPFLCVLDRRRRRCAQRPMAPGRRAAAGDGCARRRARRRHARRRSSCAAAACIGCRAPARRWRARR